MPYSAALARALLTLLIPRVASYFTKSKTLQTAADSRLEGAKIVLNAGKSLQIGVFGHCQAISRCFEQPIRVAQDLVTSFMKPSTKTIE